MYTDTSNFSAFLSMFFGKRMLSRWLFLVFLFCLLAIPVHPQTVLGANGNAFLVKDVNPTDGSSISQLVAFQEKLFFVANDGSGLALWSSDGTTTRTTLIHSDEILELAATKKVLYFTTTNGLWSSDGTAAMPIPIASGEIIELAATKRVLYFTTAESLWATDGKVGGTTLIRPGMITELMAAGEMLYFTTSVSNGQRERLWLLDRSDANPLLLHEALGISLYYSVGRQLYFSSFSPSPMDPQIGSTRLWRTDGTQAGTTFLLRLEKNPAIREYIYTMVDLNGTSFFVKAERGRFHQAYELWKSDGTAADTQFLEVIASFDLFGWENYIVSPLVVAGGKAFCTTIFENGIEDTSTLDLWVSDGTVEGTYVVEQLTPQVPFTTDPGLIPELVHGGTQLLFTAYSEAHGRELWTSDGTASGTQLFQDINPGGDSADPSLFTIAGPYRFFVADDGQHGQELWAMPFRAAPTIILDPLTFRSSNNITLNAFINANNAETTVSFQLTTTRGDYTDPLIIPATVNAISGTTDTKVQGDIRTDLRLNTTYFYRVVASNSEGTTISAERSFTTTPYRSFVPLIMRDTGPCECYLWDN